MIWLDSVLPRCLVCWLMLRKPTKCVIGLASSITTREQVLSKSNHNLKVMWDRHLATWQINKRWSNLKKKRKPSTPKLWRSICSKERWGISSMKLRKSSTTPRAKPKPSKSASPNTNIEWTYLKIPLLTLIITSKRLCLIKMGLMWKLMSMKL